MKGAIVLALFAILATTCCYADDEIEAQLTRACLRHGDGYRMGDLSDCSKYHSCVGYDGAHVELSCPSGLRFHPNNRQCDSPREVTQCATFIS